MAKVPLVDVGSLGNPSSARQNINENNQRIEDAFDNFISRDGTGPNQMEADFDAGGFKLLNVADPVNDNDAVNKRSVRPLVEEFASEIVEVAVIGQAVVDPFTATAGQTQFNLSQPPGSINNVAVFVNGLARVPTTDFTLSGPTLQLLTLFTPLNALDKVQIRYARALPSGQSSADSVTYTPPAGAAGTVEDFLDSLPTSAGASKVSWKQLGTGSITEAIQEELRRTVRPENFGAVGDGITDDVLAFNKARDYIMSLPTGGTISCTPGKSYAFGSRWTVTKTAGKQFRVDMNGSTFTKTAGGWPGAIMYYGNPTETAGEHLVLKGPGVFQGVGASGTGLYLEWAGGSEIDGSVSFRNFVNGCYLANAFAIRFSNKCSFLYCSTGAIVCSTICHNLVVDGCGFYVNQRDIYFVSGAPAYNLSVTNCDLEGSLAAGSNSIVLEAGGSCVNVDGNYIEGNNGQPIVFGVGTDSFNFTNNWLGYNSGTQAWSNINSGVCDNNIFWDQPQNLAATVKDFDIGHNTFNGTSSKIFTPWQSVTFLNSYTNTGGSYSTVGFRKDRHGVVHLRGMTQGPADNAAFTLPVGYRPNALTPFIGLSAAGGVASLGRVQVSAGGNVSVFRTADTSCSLDMVSFTATQ